MNISPIIDSPVDADGINSIRMNLNDDFTELYQEKNDALSDTLPVFIRIRPLLPKEQTLGYNDCLDIYENCVVRATAPTDSAKFRNMEKVQDFTFTHVFGSDVSQMSLFEQTMNSAVKSFIEGQNTLLFAYGSSGSGKTYTMLGNETEPGIIPLTIQLFFQCVQGKQVPSVSFRPHNACEVIDLDPSEIAEQSIEKEKLLMSCNEDMDYTKASCSSMSVFNMTRISDSVLQDLSTLPSFAQLETSCRSCLEFQGDCYYSCWVSFLELYNEQIYDLLKPFTKSKRQTLGLGEDHNGNIFVKGLKEIHVSSISEVLNLLRLGKRNLNIATTKLNYQSSRSHCIFNIKVIRVVDPKNPSKVFVNTLSFCDLAGSERCGKTQNTGMRLKEASNINASLMVLGRCIEILRLNQTLKEKKLVPFRESKLTRLFSSFFIGKGKASMIVNVSPSSHTFDETSNVLKFSALAQQVAMKECLYGKTLARLTDLINTSRLSISSNRESIDEDFSDSAVIESRETIIKELMELAESLEMELKTEKADKAVMENKIRSDLREEYVECFAESRKFYDKRFQDMRKVMDRKDERRFKALFQSLRSDSTKDYRSSEEEEDVEDIEGNLTDDDQRESTCDKMKDIKSSTFDCVKQEILALRTKLKQQEEHVNTKSAQIEELQKMESEKMVKFEILEHEHVDLQEALLATKNELSIMQNEVEDNRTLKLRITELEANLTQKEISISNQRNTIRDLEASVTHAQDDMNENIKKATDLEQYIKVLDRQLEDAKENKKELKEALSTKTQECLKKDEIIFNLESTIKSMKEQLTGQKQLSQELEKNVNTHISELKTKNETIKTCLEKINSLEEKIGEMEEVLSQMNSMMTAKSQELSKLEEKHKKIESVLQTKEAEFVANLNKIEQYKTKISKDAEESLIREQRMLELQTLLSNTESQLKMSNVPFESTSQQTDPMKYEEQLSNLQVIVDAMKEKMEQGGNHVNQLKSEMTAKSQELLKLEKKHMEWQSILQSKEDKISEKENVLNQLKVEMRVTSNELSKLEAQCSEWKSIVQTKESELQSKDNILKQVKEELLSNNNSLSKEKENNAQLQKAICLKDVQLKEKEETMEMTSKGFSSQTNKLSKKCSELQEIVSSKENEVKERITIVNKLNNKIQSLDAQLKEKEETMERTSKEFSLETDELSKKCSELQEIVSSKENEVKEQITIVNELNKNIQSLNDVVSENETKLSKTAEILLQKENKIEVLSEKISQLEAEKKNAPVVESEEMNESKANQSLEDSDEEEVIILDDDDEEIEIISTDELHELLKLLQKIERVAAKNWEGKIKIDDKKIKRISKFIVKNSKLAAQQDELKSKLQNCDRMITAKDTSIKDLEKALKDQKEIEQAERDMCKNQYETKIEKLQMLKANIEEENKKLKEEKLKAKQYEAELKKLNAIKEVLEKESKKLKEELKSKYEMKFEEMTQMETSEKENKKLKEQLKSKEKPESDEKEQFLKPRIGRPRKLKNSLENSNQNVEDYSKNQIDVAESGVSPHLKGTLPRRRSLIDDKDNEVEIPSTKQVSPPRMSQRRKKTSPHDIPQENLPNGDSEPKTESFENASPKPKLKGKRKSSSADLSSNKKSIVEADSELKNDEKDENPPSKPKQGRFRKKIMSFEKSKDNSDADFELPKRKTLSRATRSNSSLPTEELKKPVRPTRVTRNKSMKIKEDEEPKAGPTTKAIRGNPEERKKVDESPLDKIKNFVSGAVPKIKSAAEHVSSMLSPAIARKEIPPPSTRKKRKLFTDDCQPILATFSPVQKEKEPVERRTRGRQPKRAKK